MPWLPPPVYVAPPPPVYVYPPPPIILPPPDETTRGIQQSLNFLIGANLNVDGVYGPSTVDAVYAYQRMFHLFPDGIVGIGTMESLQHEIAIRMPLPPPPPPAK